MLITIVSFLASVIILLLMSRNGGINYQNKTETIERLALFYFPLLTLMAAFFFGKGGSGSANAPVPFDAFVFAAAIVTLWVLTPIFFLFAFYIEDVIVDLPKIKPYGDSVSLLALGYYFSKDNTRRRRTALTSAEESERAKQST